MTNRPEPAPSRSYPELVSLSGRTLLRSLSSRRPDCTSLENGSARGHLQKSRVPPTDSPSKALLIFDGLRIVRDRLIDLRGNGNDGRWDRYEPKLIQRTLSD